MPSSANYAVNYVTVPTRQVASTFDQMLMSSTSIQSWVGRDHTMMSQSPSPELILKAIEAHLSPTIHFKFLPRALDIIAHAALLASKLSEEITRILESDALVIKQGGYTGLGGERIEALQGKRSEAEEASAALWKLSVQIRLHVSPIPLNSWRDLMISTSQQSLVPTRNSHPKFYR